MGSERSWHYIAPSGSSRWPRKHIIIDTEARTDRDKKGWSQTWRVGVATYVTRSRSRADEVTQRIYATPREMWEDVTAWVPRKGRAILWAHNVGYDLRTARALTILPSLGWRLVSHNLADQGTWLVWRRGDQSLTVVDSLSHLVMGLPILAKHHQLAKVALPSEQDSMDKWTKRCVRDVDILTRAVCAYLDRLEMLDLGGWQMTGTGQAWAAFRRHHVTHPMLVHWDTDARAAERRAMWTGRCEAYWHGRVRGTRVDEWDMALAYPRIAMSCAVPTELVTTFGGDADLHRWLGRDGYAVLAEVDVSTGEPLVPCERDGRICWPVGSFRTVLWDPELRLLIERGASVSVVRGWAYSAEPALESWARWIIDEMGKDDRQCPGWWYDILKSWARALIGRMAMTYQEWEHVATVRTSLVRRASYVDVDTGEVGQLVQVGREVFVATRTVEWDSSIPQVTGWVQSEARAVITRVWLDGPDRKILYMDTDSLLSTEDAYDDMVALAARWPGAGLRLKRSWRGVEIKGPRQIITGDRIRVSGIPKRTQRLANGELTGEVWQSLTGALTARNAGSVRITPRRWRLRGVDARRTEGPDGWTLPIEAGSDHGDQ